MTNGYGPLRKEDEEGYLHALGCAFDSTPEILRPWLEQAGHQNIRVIRHEGSTVGGLFLLPMGQFFGGRSVPMAGVAGVAVAPQMRGRGLAKTMMSEALREMHASGFAISTLYASTTALYRSVGYEQAGTHCLATIRPSDLPRPKSDMPVRSVTDDDIAAIEALYRSCAEDRDGYVDRHAYVWGRVREPSDLVARGYVIESPDGAHELEGYVYLHSTGKSDSGRITIGDWCASTPRAFRAVQALLGGHTTIWKEVAWKTGPYDALIAALPDPAVDVTVKEYFHVRIVDITSALSQRGYRTQAATELHLSLTDEVIPKNTGRFVLEVAGGRGEVRSGGEGHLQLDVRALAPLFTGLMSAEDLALSGRTQGAPETLSRATSLFASRPPSTPDFF